MELPPPDLNPHRDNELRRGRAAQIEYGETRVATRQQSAAVPSLGERAFMAFREWRWLQHGWKDKRPAPVNVPQHGTYQTDRDEAGDEWGELTTLPLGSWSIDTKWDIHSNYKGPDYRQYAWQISQVPGKMYSLGYGPPK